MATRRVDIKVRVTAEQRAELQAAARALGLTMTDYISFKSLGDAREHALLDRLDAHLVATDAALADALRAQHESTTAALEQVRTEVIAQGDRMKSNLEKLASALLRRQPS